MIDYAVCAHDSLADLVKDVNELLAAGYELAGNLVIVEYRFHDGMTLMFYQPMIRRVDERGATG